MRKLNKLTRRALISCPTIAVVGLLAHGIFSNEAKAQTLPGPCGTLGLTNVVYVEGSTAADSVITALGPKLAMAATPITLVYVSGGTIGSCDGVDAIVRATPSSATAAYWDATGVKNQCTLNANVIDVGVSDVFPTSCPEITTDLLTGIGDFPGPVQSMNFVVPSGAMQNSISANAAYLTVGLGATGGTDWDNPAFYAFRNFNSGTQTMIASAINVPTAKWPGGSADAGGSGAVVTRISSNATPADKTIGILASNQADNNRDTIKRLAFQGFDQSCAYYPDSQYSSKDKLNVRDGTYDIWGPSHVLAKVGTDGVPTDPKAKQLIDILEGTVTLTGVDVVDLEIGANTTPQCAMHVKRTTEHGKPVAYTPDVSCSCYFDSKRGDAMAAGCVVCTTATADADCPAGKKACNHGYCEVK